MGTKLLSGDSMILLTVQLLSEEEVKKVFDKEFAKELIDEGGWWFKSSGRVLVVDQADKRKNAENIVHEVVEYLLEGYMGFNHEEAHRIASDIEKEFVIKVLLAERRGLEL